MARRETGRRVWYHPGRTERPRMPLDPDPIIGRSVEFPSTHWSLVMQAGSASSPEAGAALAELCDAYWYPIYAFIRRKGNYPDKALDLTQSYFERLLTKPVIVAADRSKGRFRSFLKTDCQHFLVSRYRSQVNKPHNGAISIDGDEAEKRYRIEPVDEMTPERQFDRTWAITLLGRALDLLAQEYQSKEKAEVFELLKPVLIQGEVDRPVADLAARLGTTEGAIYTATNRLRKRYGEILRREVAATLDGQCSPEEEIQLLFGALRP
jgi:DNA-directed RNA polymerase specialized sigma24 family protein